VWDWLDANGDLLWWMFALSIVTFVGSLIAIPVLAVRMRADYFLRDKPPTPWHPLLHLVVVAGKNVLAAVLIAAGFAMLVLPGQGILTILVGVLLLSFPGKRKLELWLLRRPRILRTINRARRRWSKPPLELPDKL